MHNNRDSFLCSFLIQLIYLTSYFENTQIIIELVWSYINKNYLAYSVSLRVCPRGAVANVRDCKIVIMQFELKSHY